MTSLPIASNNLQASTNAANSPQKNGASDAQSPQPFGAVLARQIEGNNPASKAPSDAPAAKEEKKDKASATDDAGSDSANTLIAMLQLPPDIRRTVAREALEGATTSVRNTSTPGATTDQPSADLKPGSAAPNAIVGIAANAISPDYMPATGTSLTELAQPAAGINTKIEASGKADKAIVAQPNDSLQAAGPIDIAKLKHLARTESDTSDSPATSPGSPTSTPALSQPVAKAFEISAQSQIKSAELPGAAQPSPNITPGAAMLASGISPSMLNNTSSTAPTQAITAAVGSASWPDEFSQKISWMGTQQHQIAELHLNPPDLGPLNVVLKITGNEASALFTSPHGAVRDAVENALPRLRETLADAGITLGNATVSDQSLPNRDAGSFMNQGSGTSARREALAAPAEAISSLTGPAPAAPARRHNGVVDIFA